MSIYFECNSALAFLLLPFFSVLSDAIASGALISYISHICLRHVCKPKEFPQNIESIWHLLTNITSWRYYLLLCWIQIHVVVYLCRVIGFIAHLSHQTSIKVWNKLDQAMNTSCQVGEWTMGTNLICKEWIPQTNSVLTQQCDALQTASLPNTVDLSQSSVLSHLGWGWTNALSADVSIPSPPTPYVPLSLTSYIWSSIRIEHTSSSSTHIHLTIYVSQFLYIQNNLTATDK